MTQSQLDHAVARATGETVNTIRNHGFSPLYLPQVVHGPSGSNQQARLAAKPIRLQIASQPLRKAA